MNYMDFIKIKTALEVASAKADFEKSSAMSLHCFC